MVEKAYRSIIKAFSWRITATITTVVIAYFITGEVAAALSIGFIEFFAKMLLYYGHERLWNRINIGRVKPEYHI
eukprot:SAG22_NODE_4330_length_1301_cov_1.148918_2_plen_74_part_00